MQSNQMFYGPNMYPSFGQYTPPNQPSYQQPQPQLLVAGEGDVATIVNPDGSLQFLFVPTRRWPSADDPYRTIGSPYSAPEAWVIKSVLNPMPVASFLQPYPRIGLPQGRPDYNPAYNCPPYQVKFHNDGWTSTTDLHYFFPNLRYCPWIPKVCGSVGVQVESNIWCQPSPSILKKPSVECMNVDKPHCSKNVKAVHFDDTCDYDGYKEQYQLCDCESCYCNQCSDKAVTPRTCCQVTLERRGAQTQGVSQQEQLTDTRELRIRADTSEDPSWRFALPKEVVE